MKVQVYPCGLKSGRWMRGRFSSCKSCRVALSSAPLGERLLVQICFLQLHVIMWGLAQPCVMHVNIKWGEKKRTRVSEHAAISWTHLSCFLLLLSPQTLLPPSVCNKGSCQPIRPLLKYGWRDEREMRAYSSLLNQIPLIPVSSLWSRLSSLPSVSSESDEAVVCVLPRGRVGGGAEIQHGSLYHTHSPKETSN